MRCEQREINAAKQVVQTNQRQHETTNPQERVPNVAQEATVERAPMEAPTPSISRAANDHLPHNVIMLARPQEQEFNANELSRQDHEATTRTDQVAEQRADLKDHQRAEREAIFKDGAKLFKATRHAAYDEERQKYKAECRQFYKDSDTAQKSAEASSETAMGRAFHFAKEGQWDTTRNAFNDRDSVRDATEKDLADRKDDLKQRQNADLRERQHDACDALRQVRDVQYQELLQRQRDERAAFKVSETLEALGIGGERQHDDAAKSLSERVANENRVAEAAPVQIQKASPSAEAARAEAKPDERQIATTPEPLFRPLEHALQSDAGGHIDLPDVKLPTHEAVAPVRGVADLAASGMLKAASYLADQLGELFAPTPPEVREAQAKAEAKVEASREAERPAPEDKAAAYERIIGSAVLTGEADKLEGFKQALFAAFVAAPKSGIPNALVDLVATYTSALRLQLTLRGYSAVPQRTAKAPMFTAGRGK